MQEIIRIEGLTKFYRIGDETIKALNGVDLSISKNEYVALMGPSGSGKSTIMNIIGCLDTPTSGSYFLNGPNVANLDDNNLAEIRNKEIGFIFQTFNLLPRYSSLDNVALPLVYAGIPKDVRNQKAKDSLQSVGLADRMNHKPNELSGGQRQRVAVARALVNNPSIILADEPTGNLDNKNSLIVFDIFKELAEVYHQTLLIVTHDQSFAANTSRIIEMEDGRIIRQ